jgi:hypothetical protein|tara:strand:- start:482 stop:745 length:264 start_codon:yes stop_codon:yes gene_type:complete
MDIKIIKRIILEGLLTPPRWGSKHTEMRNIKKGFPSKISSSNKGKKLIDKAIKELINEGFLLCKKSTQEFHISLNPRMKKEIMEFVK